MKRQHPRFLRRSRCRATPHKAAYERAAFAWQTGAKQIAKSGRALYVYQCPSCGAWHLTHRDGPGSVRIETKRSGTDGSQ